MLFRSGDQAQRAPARNVHTFVQGLGGPHGAGGSEVQAAAGLLLQGGSDERGRGGKKAFAIGNAMHPACGSLFIYASNEPKSVLARDLGDCRVNLKNTLCKFLIVLQEIVFLLNKKPYARKSAAIYKTDIVRTAADALTGKSTEK